MEEGPHHDLWNWRELRASVQRFPSKWAWLPWLAFLGANEFVANAFGYGLPISDAIRARIFIASTAVGPLLLWHIMRVRDDALERRRRARRERLLLLHGLSRFDDETRAFGWRLDQARNDFGTVTQNAAPSTTPAGWRQTLMKVIEQFHRALHELGEKRPQKLGIVSPGDVRKALPERYDGNIVAQRLRAREFVARVIRRTELLRIDSNALQHVGLLDHSDPMNDDGY